MPIDLYIKIYNFLSSVKEKDIITESVIYQRIEKNPWITQNELKSIIKWAVIFVKNQYEWDFSCHTYYSSQNSTESKISKLWVNRRFIWVINNANSDTILRKKV